MTTVVINTDTNDGYLYNSIFNPVNYNTVWAATDAEVVNDFDAINLYVGQSYEITYDEYGHPTGEILYINRIGISFNTSTIPSNAIIDSAKLTLSILYDYSTTDFNIVIQDGQPAYPHMPLIVGDYNKENYSGNGGSVNTAGITNPFDIMLNDVGKSWLNKGGLTKFILRSSLDIAGTAPTLSVSEQILLKDFGYGAPYIPKLSIDYHLEGAWIQF
jgi:hypothetical protein